MTPSDREKERKRVAYIATLYRHFVQFHMPYFEELMQLGFEVTCIAKDSDNESKSKLEKLGIRCVDVPFERRMFSIHNIKAYAMLKKIFAIEQFDLLVFNVTLSAFFGRLASRKSPRSKSIFISHGLRFYESQNKLRHVFFFLLEKIVKKYTDVMIVVSKEDIKSAEKLGYQFGNDVFLINGIGVDLSDFDFDREKARNLIRREFGIETESTVFVNVAEMNRNKNQRFLLKTWKDLGSYSNNATLILVGEGALRNKLTEFCRSNHLDNVVFAGYRKDVPKILAASDVLIAVSRREGLPKNVLEGMASRLPIIATNIRGHRELIESNINGFLVDLGRSNELLKAIIFLNSNQSTRRIMGNISREKVNPYSIKETKKSFIEVLKKCLQKL